MAKTAPGAARTVGDGPADAGNAGSADAPGARLRAAAARGSRVTAAAARRHWLFSVLLVAGLALRVMAQITYRPALLYIDTLKYLYNAWPGTDPVGYKVPLKAILLVGNLQAVTAVQHLVGLAMAVGIYAVLLRRGVPRWLAALAAAPVLLDAYELQIEQTIMYDVWFEALIVAALVLLLWQPRPTLPKIVLAGVALGLAVTTAQVGEVLILPAAIYVVVAAGGWRRAIRALVAVCVSFAVPILAYMSISQVVTGHFWLSRSGVSTVYGRVAEAADCATLKLPSYARPLCPTPLQARKLGADGLDHSPTSPLTTYLPPAGMSQASIVSAFTRAVIVQQPMRVLSSIADDSARLFAVKRVGVPGDTPISRWQFQTEYPSYQNYIRTNSANVIILGLKLQTTQVGYVYQPLDPSMGGKAQVTKPLATFLRAYQLDGGYTPGPLYLAATLLGLFGTLAAGRRISAARRGRPRPAGDDLALACGLFFVTAATLLLASDIPEFSWRYQLPALVTLPPAGAAGIAFIVAVVRSRRGRTNAAGAASSVADGGRAPAMRVAPDRASDPATAPDQATPTR
ncbi:MAG TPA: hypothetical protein VHY31_25880 [Streptosporangiaceae bacterium]|jgi:hypothetical protein|nr:hypothetical protein [Streptosporangiaceae bacterium]